MRLNSARAALFMLLTRSKRDLTMASREPMPSPRRKNQPPHISPGQLKEFIDLEKIEIARESVPPGSNELRTRSAKLPLLPGADLAAARAIAETLAKVAAGIMAQSENAEDFTISVMT